MFTKDTDPRKVNLGIGAYRDNTGALSLCTRVACSLLLGVAGKPWILPSVRKAEQAIQADGYKTYNHEYLGIAGYAPFYTKARELMFGATNPAVKAGRIATVQTLSGTGSIPLVLILCLAYSRFAFLAHNRFAVAGRRLHFAVLPQGAGLPARADLGQPRSGSLVISSRNQA